MGVRRATSRARLFELNKFGKTSTSVAGTGISPIVVASSLQRSGYHIITELALDLGSSRTTTLSASEIVDRVIGVSSSTGTHNPANLITLSTATNGHLVAVEMYCLEQPSGSAGVSFSYSPTSKDIDLYAFNGATKTVNQDVAAGSKLIDSNGNWSLGDFKSWTSGEAAGVTVVALARSGNVPGDSFSLYLANGMTLGAAGGLYTQGKYVIRLIGVAVPEDL